MMAQMKMLVILTLTPTVHLHVTTKFADFLIAFAPKMVPQFLETFVLRMIDVTEFLRWYLLPSMMLSTTTTLISTKRSSTNREEIPMDVTSSQPSLFLTNIQTTRRWRKCIV